MRTGLYLATSSTTLSTNLRIAGALHTRQLSTVRRVQEKRVAPCSKMLQRVVTSCLNGSGGKRAAATRHRTESVILTALIRSLIWIASTLNCAYPHPHLDC